MKKTRKQVAMESIRTHVLPRSWSWVLECWRNKNNNARLARDDPPLPISKRGSIDQTPMPMAGQCGLDARYVYGQGGKLIKEPECMAEVPLVSVQDHALRTE